MSAINPRTIPAMARDFSSALKDALARLKCDLKLKEKQKEAMKAMYEGNDVFLWLPTGYGKSICYQILPFLFDYKLKREGLHPSKRSVCVVVSPLISLMVDQVKTLRSIGVGSAILSGNTGVDKSLLASENNIKSGDFSLLFSAPEAIISSDRWRDILTEEPLCHQVVAIAVDEAHCVYKWGSKFRPSYTRIHELRSLLPADTPVLACSATVTKAMLKNITQALNMVDYQLVHVSPERPNTCYQVQKRTTIENDLETILTDLKFNSIKATRVLIYCQSLNMCSDLYAHFRYELGDQSYYPPGADKLAANRIFGMYHSGTAHHNKDVIMRSMADANGIVRVVFATIALGMGVNLIGLNTVIHYGAPRSLEDYFQESGRAGRSGEQSCSTVYWCPSDAPKYKDTSDLHRQEVVLVRTYLENTQKCRRLQLLEYFIGDSASKNSPDNMCCDVCNDSNLV